MLNRILLTRGVSIFVLLSLLFPFFDVQSVSSQAEISQDTFPPAPVIDLSASPGAVPGSVELNWIAPGNDGTTGTAAAYVVRFNRETITEDNWADSMDVAGEPLPSTAGSLQTMIVSGLAGGVPYHFALKTEDDVSNVSGVSNSPLAVTQSWTFNIKLPIITRSYEGGTVIPDKTVVISDSSTQYLESISDDMTFSFSQWTPELEELDPGDIMVGDVANAAPSGFLRKVASISTLCDNVVVKTEVATLEEAIDTGSIDINQALKPSQVSEGQYADGVSNVSSPDGLLFEFYLEDVVLYDNDGDIRTVSDQITGDGKIAVEVGVDFGIKIKWFKVTQVRFIASASETVEISVKWNYALAVNKRIPLKFATLKFNPITVMVGPVPVVIVPKMTLGVNLEGEVAVGVTAGVIQQATIKLGATYENGSWSPVKEFSNKFEFDPPQVYVSGMVKAGLGPEFEMMLYGAMGPYIGKNFFVQVEAIGSVEGLEVSLYAGLELYAGAKIQIMGKLLEDYKSPTIGYRLLIHSWPFGMNKPPDAPSSPIPIDNAEDQPMNPILTWTGKDPDPFDIVTYDVYLEANDSYPDVLVSAGQGENYFDTGVLAADTYYYWRVVAKDPSGATGAGLVWSFRTGSSINTLPYVPSSPTPADMAGNQLIYLNLSWMGGDPDGDAVSYDVYLAKVENPAVLICEDVLIASCYSGPLETLTEYYWQVISTDEHGGTNPGAQWTFVTSSSTNQPPYTPEAPMPADGWTENVWPGQVRWDSSDPDGDPVTYNVYFEAEDDTPDVLLCENLTGFLCDYDYLVGNTHYYWQVVASDNNGATTTGPVWMFATSNHTAVPPGEFQMGCDQCNPDEQCLPDELPLHPVYLDGFVIDRTEVTNAEYAMCVNGGYCDPPLYYSSRTHSSYYDNPEFADYPVLWVDYNNAGNYCGNYGGGPLPTEAQWEKAARGSSDVLLYPWGSGDADCSRLNYSSWNGSAYEYCVGDTSPVGSYPSGASPYGALDMSGNVSEWVRDWYGSDYYSELPYLNPTGPGTGDFRLVRGGSWLDLWDDVRTARRLSTDPDFSSDSTGFRCVYWGWK